MNKGPKTWKNYKTIYKKKRGKVSRGTLKMQKDLLKPLQDSALEKTTTPQIRMIKQKDFVTLIVSTYYQ